MRVHSERAAKGLAEKLQSLPLVDGQPDVAPLGDPTLVARQWAAELHLSREEQLQELLEYLEKMRAGAEEPTAKTVARGTKEDGPES